MNPVIRPIPHCPFCDYSLAGLSADPKGRTRCPECGRLCRLRTGALPRVYTRRDVIWACCWPAAAVVVFLAAITALSPLLGPGGISPLLAIPCGLTPGAAAVASIYPPVMIHKRLAEQWQCGFRSGPGPVALPMALATLNIAGSLAALCVAYGLLRAF